MKQNNAERKVTLRFRTNEQRFHFDYLENVCNQAGVSLSTYLINVVANHASDLIKKKTIPDFTNTLYGVTRKAVYAGTVGQNIYTAKQIKPVVEDMEILDLKMNLVLNILLNQVDTKRYTDLQQPPDKYLNEFDKFKELRERIDKHLNKNIKTYINKVKNVESNNTKFADSVSFEEYALSPSVKEKEISNSVSDNDADEGTK